jgi:hypothetical protein
MNTTEISDEAKQALANLAQRKASDRLRRDGCRDETARAGPCRGKEFAAG